MNSEIFKYKNLLIYYLKGCFLKTIPPSSIALDGIYKGAMIDPFKNSISFDHHSVDIPRHAQSATVRQVADAFIVGWNPPVDRGLVTVFINDIDLDTLFSLYLLTVTKKEVINKRMLEWVNVINGADSFGPAYTVNSRFVNVRDFLYYNILKRHSGRTAGEVITAILNNIEFFSKKSRINYSYKKSGGTISILEQSLFIHPGNLEHPLMLMAIYSEDPVFEYGYREGGDIVIGIRRYKNSLLYKYAIAKRNDFVSYNLSRLLEQIGMHEVGWGGGTSLIGSPEKGSKIQPHQLINLVKTGELVETK